MQSVYFVCAVTGGAAIAWQFLMSLLGGFGDHDGEVGVDTGDDADWSDDIDDHGGNGDLHLTQAAGHHSGSVGNGNWFLGLLTLRTLIAGIAFFGFAGMACSTGGMAPLPTFAIAVASGCGALYLVAWMMQSLSRLKADGTAQIKRSVGQPATVYLTVPAAKSGSGKVLLNIQNRTMEYLAVTSERELPTGTTVLVVGIVGPDTVEVSASQGMAVEAV